MVSRAHLNVAPYAGAWIEITCFYASHCRPRVAPYAGAWIEIATVPGATGNQHVAPYAGAWIEMLGRGFRIPSHLQSLPTRERGLKYVAAAIPHIDSEVAPYAGAWIEILFSKYARHCAESLPTRERGLK